MRGLLPSAVLAATLALAGCSAASPDPTARTHSLSDAAETLGVEEDAMLVLPDGFFTLTRDGDRVSLVFLPLGGATPERLAAWDDPPDFSLTWGQIVVCGDRWGFDRSVFLAGRWAGRDPVRFIGADAVGGRLGEDEFLFALDGTEVARHGWRVAGPDRSGPAPASGAESTIVFGDRTSFARVAAMVPPSGDCVAPAG